MYAHYVNSENLPIQNFPNGKLTEYFPKEDQDRIPDTTREYQAEINRQEEHSEEFLDHPNLKVDAENITLTEYSLQRGTPHLRQIWNPYKIYGTSISFNRIQHEVNNMQKSNPPAWTRRIQTRPNCPAKKGATERL